MILNQQHRDDFERDGCTLIDSVLGDEIVSRSDQAIFDFYNSGEPSDGIVGLPKVGGLLELFQSPQLENIAQHILETNEVVINSGAILFKRPEPGVELKRHNEHVDIMFTREEWLSRPRSVLCMLMVMLADLPDGRANTYVRIGSHMQLADWLDHEKKEPIKAQPTWMKDLPELDWSEPTPVVAKAGQVLAFNTNLIHGGSTNTDSEARRIMFVNFCPRGKMAVCSGNANRREKCDEWRAWLRSEFRPERKHLMYNDDD